MKTVWILAVALLLGCVAAKQKKHKKKNDWDGLGSLLRQLDKIEKIKTIQLETDEEAEDEDDDDEELLDKEKEGPTTEAPLRRNPCEDHHCGWGKECILGKGNKPRCECMHECPTIPDPDPFDKVCSNHNETFDSICHLYQQRCLCKKNKSKCQQQSYKRIHLQYLGMCKDLEPCTKEHLDQFPGRMADWLFQVMRDLKKRQELHGDDWIQMIEEAENDDHLKHVYPVIWKFCDLDIKPHDKEVSHHELVPIIAPVMPMESCIKPFLQLCDANDDNKINLREWGKCLGLQKGEIVERC